MTLADAVAHAFSPEGALARVVDGYEPREGQRAMAAAVASVVDTGDTLLAEAGTGTGKTLAYLIPAILSRQRVLVSTGTKNLQEQIFFKDLPALQEALGVPFTATLMKGRSNYLCLHRLDHYREQSFEGFDGAVFLPIIQEWAKSTTTGDRAELRDLPEEVPLWRELAATAETCLGTECPRYGDCFVTLMRQRAAESDVVIVNHHLLCADAAVRHGDFGEVIPSCPTLVVDEAHQLEDVATNFFGYGVSNHRFDELVRDAAHALKTSGPRGTPVEDAARAFFAHIARARFASGPSEMRARYTAESMGEYLEDGLILAAALERLEADLVLAARPAKTNDPNEPNESNDPNDPNDTNLLTIARRAAELRTDLKFLLRADDPDYVYFVESRGRGLFLRAAPIDVSRIVREALFDRFRTTVLTSATLAVDGSFDYVRSRLGLRAADEVRVPSEFDYARQALLYLPRRMPPPKSPAFAEAAARETIELLRRSQGRAFVLFTSYAVLRVVQQFVELALPYPVFVQGTAPRSKLIDEFRSTPNAVLLATSSFWQGVDVVGDALSCVIIDKLPFASPSDPVTAARIDAIRADGRDAFSEYQVPLAILTLQQGLGRLIRHRSDRGVLAVLDPRLRTMGYGRRFLASLPAAPVTGDLAAVDNFFV
jgi:ATP-dependent DNA helicase DinG